MNLTREEKEARLRLKSFSDKIRFKFALHKIKTYKDLLLAAGHNESKISTTWFPSELDRQISGRDVEEFLSNIKIDLETSQWLAHNPPQNMWSEYDEEKDYVFPSQVVRECAEEVYTIGDVESQMPSNQMETVVADPEIPSEEEVLLEKNYGLPSSPNETAKLFWFQKKAASQVLVKFVIEDVPALLFVAGTGTGKTFVNGAVLRRLVDSHFCESIGSVAPHKILYVTKASIVEQTKRVLKNHFNLSHKDVLVINYDQLRATAGQLWIREEKCVENGIERIEYVWREYINPVVVVWDECQSLKNYGSSQHKVGASFNNIPFKGNSRTYQIFSSASPGHRVADFKCFCCATRHVSKFAAVYPCEVDNDNWNTFAVNVSHPSLPLENSPPAVDRLMDEFEKYIIRVKGVKPQFKANNKILMINFESAEDAKYYDDAVKNFQIKKLKTQAKLEAGEITAGMANINLLTAMLQYRIAAESNPGRIKYIVKAMMKSVAEGYAAACGLNFKISIIRCVKMMVNDFKIPRDKISLIWGGGQSAVTDKQKAKAVLTTNDELMAALEAAGVTLEDLQLDDVEGKIENEELDPALRLGPQSLVERQKEIDRFQSGKSLYCFYIFKSGGVGLSLHHTDEFTKEKVRKKKSGYAYVEDIPKISTRPRRTYLAPTWSAIEMVQGLGRVPRLTSLSTTDQFLIFFSGTIEEKVARIVARKLRCLQRVVRQKEDWSDIAKLDMSDSEIEAEHMKDEVDDQEVIFASATESEDEDD